MSSEQVEILSKKAAEAHKEADQAMAQLSRARNCCRMLAAASEEAEIDLNRGLKNLHQLVEPTAAAAGALCCGTGHRKEDERTCLDADLALLDRIQSDEDTPNGIVAVDGT